MDAQLCCHPLLQAASGSSGSSGSAINVSASSSSAAGSTWLTRLRENKPGGGQTAQPILLPSQTGSSAAGTAGAAAGAASGAAGIHLFVGVLSAAARRQARDAIRASWGAHPGAYRTRFFLARPANDTLFAEVGWLLIAGCCCWTVGCLCCRCRRCWLPLLLLPPLFSRCCCWCCFCCCFPARSCDASQCHCAACHAPGAVLISAGTWLYPPCRPADSG